MITLPKKSDPGQFAIPYHLGLQVEPSKESFTFVDCSQSSSEGVVRDLKVQIGAMCNLQTNQLCLTLIYSLVHYNPIPVKKPQTSSRRINDPELIAACHCGAEYEKEYSASIETHTATSIDSSHQKSTDTPKEESVNSSPEDWENDYYNPTMVAHIRHTMHTKEYDEDYEKERAIKYKAVLDEEDRLLHHSSWKRNAPSIDRICSTSIDTHPHQTSRNRASTDIAYFPSIDTGVDRIREGDYSIGSGADDHHHESYAVETTIPEPGADEMHKGFTHEELPNMKRRDDADRRVAIDREIQESIDSANRPSIDEKPPSLIDIRTQMANGADNLFMQQRTVPAHQQRELCDTDGGIDNRFKRAIDLFGTRKFYWEEKDEYGFYRDDQGCARDVDGHVINVSKDDIRKLMERASRDEHIYICLPEHASSFTQTKLVPKIYTKDEINEMFYEVCGAQEKNEGDFQMKLDGVYYPLNDSISWLTTCMEKMRQDIAKIQHAADRHRPESIDRHYSTSIDDDPKNSFPMKSQPDFHT
ncbi:hypothetical protein F2Q68_00025257 [Brassica cretica]|uniref:Uncharacterized protein n=2 Tax=Brassica cretica TaxID=69181 RepID=A0A8S9I806_BRACR|nr:hypothetical protein F2Q68_00025257 [Brassica cretica]KAF3581145.1 hypothetical protein DY000_02030890 [Brassica cretica]